MELRLVRRDLEKRDMATRLQLMNPLLVRQLQKEIATTVDPNYFDGVTIFSFRPIEFPVSNKEMVQFMQIICDNYGLKYDIPRYPASAIVLQRFCNFVLDAVDTAQSDNYTYYCPVCGCDNKSLSAPCRHCGFVQLSDN